MVHFCRILNGWVESLCVAWFKRKSSFHTFSLVMYTHTTTSSLLMCPLTQINNPNKAFHERSAYKRWWQQRHGRHFIGYHPSISLFTPPRLLSCALIHPDADSRPPACFYLKLRHHSACRFTQGHQSNHAITHTLGKSGVLYMTAPPKCRVCLCSVVTCPFLLCWITAQKVSLAASWARTAR